MFVVRYSRLADHLIPLLADEFLRLAECDLLERHLERLDFILRHARPLQPTAIRVTRGKQK